MKKIILIIILFNLFSCNDYDEIIKEEETNQILQKKGSTITLSKGGEKEDGLLIPIFNKDIADKLDIYSYVLGRVLLKNSLARTEIINNTSSNNTIDLNITLYNNTIIRTAFIAELNELVFSEFGDLIIPYGNNGAQTFRIRPPLTTKKPGPITYSLATIIQNEILNNTFANHFEMYMPNTLVFSNLTGMYLADNDGNQYSNFDTIYTGYNPIYNSTATTTGYSLTFAAEINGGTPLDRGDSETYNTVYNHSGNVAIIRVL